MGYKVPGNVTAAQAVAFNGLMEALSSVIHFKDVNGAIEAVGRCVSQTEPKSLRPWRHPPVDRQFVASAGGAGAKGRRPAHGDD